MKIDELPAMIALFKLPVLRHRSLLLLTSGLLFVTLGASCKMMQKAADVPGQTVSAVTPEAQKQKKKSIDPVEVQQNLLRFADEFSMRMNIGVEKLSQGSETFTTADALEWKIAVSTETCAIASGPNAVADLLDMTVFVTVMRIAVEEYWLPVKFGDSARPLLEVCRDAEADIWRLTATILKPEQLKELRQGIDAWRKKNPLPKSVLAARALGFATEIERSSTTEKNRSESVFSLLRIDPLAGMDPAVREIAQTRLFAERALYVTQKMPLLLRWQIELLTANAVNQPSVQQLVANTTQLSASVERFAQIAEKLPGLVSAEHEAIRKTLQEQEAQLTPLINEVRQTLTAGEHMSTSLNTTLVTFDTLMKRFGVSEPAPADTGKKIAGNSQADATARVSAKPAPDAPPPPAAEPFRIQDYTETAAQLEATAKQLTELIRTLDQTLGSPNLTQLTDKVAPVVQQAQAGGREVVDYAFKKGLLLLLLAFLAALTYRMIATRWIAPKK